MKSLHKKLKYFFGLGFAAVLVFSTFFTAILSTQSAYAAEPPATSGSWVNNQTIRYNGQDFKGPTEPTANIWRYTSTSAVPNCSGARDYIEFDQNPTFPGTPASPGFLDFNSGETRMRDDGAGGTVPVEGCFKESNVRITLTNTQNAKLSEARARCAGQADERLENCIQQSAEEACADRTTEGANAACIRAYIAANATPDNAIGDNDQVAAPVEDPQLDCDAGWNPLTWFVCPVIKLVNATINGLDAAIVGLLTIEQEEIFDTTSQPGAGYYEAWSTFRNIALGILVIGALIMLISQALGFDFLDAYTIKKVLPRLVIAIIGIALSWELMRFMVVFTNDLGLGIRQLIYYPFIQGNVDGNDAIIGGGEATIIALLTTGAFLGLGLLGILSFGLTALLALFIAFMVLVLRQIIIIMLILFAPIAIACYILPNTQGVWKIWNESFEKALLMFPIIMALLAVGRVMSMVASGDQASFVGQLVAFIAYILPYFLIPLTFRFAGGALRTLGGFVNDNGRGGFDRLKKYRQNTRAERMGAIKQGFERTRLGTNIKDRRQKSLDKLTAMGSGAVRGTSRYRSELEHAELGHMAHEAQEAIKKNPAAAANDDANKVAQHATSKEDFIRRYMASKPGSTREEAISQLAYTEQAYGTVMGSQQMKHTAGTAALASNSSTDSVAERAQWMRDAVSNHVMSDSQASALVKQSGSLASSAGFGDLLQAANGTMSDDELLKRATLGFNPANSHRLRKGQAKEMAQEVFRQIDEAERTHGVGSDEFAKAIADAAGMHDSMNGMTPDVREEFARHLNGQAVAGRYVREHESAMEMSGNGAYLDRRKTWASTAVAAGGATGTGGPVGGPGPSGPAGGGGTVGGGPGTTSDIRLKRNIFPIAITTNNIQLYRFQYLWSDQIYVGVMAQDLLHTHQEAILEDGNGFYLVNYEMLGLQMLTLEDWDTKQSNLTREQIVK